ncbi:MAG: rhodanese-like domain-containing protein [Phycisphaeraceae bacterium]|nr:rhodanese-like domain-containing protein [Phycisphaeraceae bacterium]
MSRAHTGESDARTAGLSAATGGSGVVSGADPDSIRRWVDDGGTVLIDVREPAEFRAEQIPGAINLPLSTFQASQVHDLLERSPLTAALRAGGSGDVQVPRFVLHCRTGNRSAQAAARCAGAGLSPAYHMEGGLEAWKQGGHPVAAPTGGRVVIDVMRQVQIAAGGLALIGFLLGIGVSPWFHVLSGFVGAGLLMAGLTGWCGMAMVLARMPWNR